MAQRIESTHTRRVRIAAEKSLARATMRGLRYAPGVARAVSTVGRLRAPDEDLTVLATPREVPLPRVPPPQVEPVDGTGLGDVVDDVGKGRGPVLAVGATSSHSSVWHGTPTTRLVRPRRGAATVRPVDAGDGLRPDAVRCERYLIGAGVRMAHALLALEADGHTLPAQTGWGGLTLVGAMATGSQGSTLGFGPLCDMVRSVHLLTLDDRGAAQRTVVEPKDGITDPAAFPTTDRLVQDDDVFDAARVSLGMLGVVTHVVVDAVPDFRLREEYVEVPWWWVREHLEDLALTTSGGIETLEIWVDPISRSDDAGCVIMRRVRTDEPVNRDDRGTGNERPADPFLLELARWIAEDVGIRPGILIQLALDAAKPKKGARPVRAARTSRDFGLKNALPMGASAVAVPLEQAAAAIDATRALLDARWRERRETVISPLGVRFARGTTAPLAPQRGEVSALLELPSYRRMKNLDGTLTSWVHHLVDAHGARPHLGLFFDDRDVETQKRVHAAYGPDLVRFKSARDKLDPKRTFNERLAVWLGI